MERQYLRMLKLSITLLIVSILSIFLLSCATTSSRQKGEIFKKMDTIPEGKGLVYLYRTHSFNAMLRNWSIRLGEPVSGDTLKRRYNEGEKLTILYDDEWVRYWKNDGENESELLDDHEIIIADKEGIPILRDDWHSIGLKNKSYYPYLLDPGEYIWFNFTNNLRITVESGKVYYIKGYVKSGWTECNLNLKQVTEEQALGEIIECNLIY